MTNKVKYRQYCNEDSSVPIYSKDWWLDAVCGYDNWDVLLVTKDDKIVASLPYYYTKKMAIFKCIRQPIFTKNSGIWIKYPASQKTTTKHRYEKEVFNEIISELKKLPVDLFKQNFHYNFSNWLPFYWENYKQQSFYSYIINDLSDLITVFNGFDAKIKTDIKKAIKNVIVTEDVTIENFYTNCIKTFERKKVKIPFTLELLKKVDEACAIKNCRKILCAKDSNGLIHAVIYIVWDNNSVYYILGGGDTKLRNSGATSLLLWHAIQFAASKKLKFDFEGSMMPSVESFFRAFGGEQKQYFEITKVNSVILRSLFAFKYILKGK